MTFLLLFLASVWAGIQNALAVPQDPCRENAVSQSISTGIGSTIGPSDPYPSP